MKLRLQDETRRRIVPQRSPEDGLIEWATDAASIDRFIRAQTRPYPGAFATLEGKPLHIWCAQVVAANGQLMPGWVERVKEGTYTIACGTGVIAVNEITYEQ